MLDITLAPETLTIYPCPDCGRLNVGGNDCPQCGAEICRMGKAIRPVKYARIDSLEAARYSFDVMERNIGDRFWAETAGVAGRKIDALLSESKGEPAKEGEIEMTEKPGEAERRLIQRIEDAFQLHGNVERWMEVFGDARAEIVATARTQALEEAARAVCYECAQGHPLNEAHGRWYSHRVETAIVHCTASPIRDLMNLEASK